MKTTKDVYIDGLSEILGLDPIQFRQFYDQFIAPKSERHHFEDAPMSDAEYAEGREVLRKDAVKIRAMISEFGLPSVVQFAGPGTNTSEFKTGSGRSDAASILLKRWRN